VSLAKIRVILGSFAGMGKKNSYVLVQGTLTLQTAQNSKQMRKGYGCKDRKYKIGKV